MEVQALKEKLSEKELRVYELELYANELNARISELSDAQENLTIANRNARTLEEENNNLTVRLRAVESGKINPSIYPTGTEAVKLVKENTDLRASLRELTTSVNQAKGDAKSKTGGLERQLRSVTEDRDRMAKERERQTKELEGARRQCVNLQKMLDEERDTTKASNDLWDQERERYTQKIDDLLATVKRAEGLTQSRDGHTKEQVNDLQVLLLKEEVDQLEKKLRISEARLWKKEKEWLRVEAELKQELADSRKGTPEASNGKEVFRALQSQIMHLKNEISQLHPERRVPRNSSVPSNGLQPAGQNGNFSGPDGGSLQSSLRGNSIGPGGRSSGIQRGPGGMGTPASPMDAQSASIERQLDDLAIENATLRSQLADLKTQLLEAQLATEERNVRIKELEAAGSASSAKNGNGPQGLRGTAIRTGPGGYKPGSPYADDNASEVSYLNRAPNQEREVAELRKKVRDLQGELTMLKATQEQKDAINKARVKECQEQIEELLQENKDMQQTNGVGMMGTSVINPDHFSSVSRLSKDKRDSVEDVMRLLETAWSNEADAIRQSRNAKMQGAAMANHDAMKDEELRHLQGLVDELRDRLSAAERDRGVVERERDSAMRDRDANDDLRGRIRDLEDENAAMKRRMRDESKTKDRNAADADKAKDALRDKIRDLEDRDRAAGDRLDSMNRQLRDLRDENNRLRRQAARSPRREMSAPHRTPERALSQLSIRSSGERKRSAVPEGAHLAVTLVELSDVKRNGQAITEPGYIIIKLKSIKEKYKTSVKELSSVIRFDESFEFYLAQPDQDVITLHVYYKPKESSREYYIGDACFSMATLYRGIPRQRIAPVAQSPGSKVACKAGLVEVILQTDDFGRMARPSEAEVEDETLRFNELAAQFESSAPEKLHAVDVYMASRELM